MSDYEEEEINYREEILRLIEEGKIKRTAKYVEKQSDESLEKMYKNYLAKKEDERNECATDVLVNQISELMAQLELIKADDKEPLKKELKDNNLFRNDVKTALGYLLPLIPCVGIIWGGVTIAKYVVRNRVSSETKEEEQV